MKTINERLEKMAKEVVYLKYEFEDAVLKFEPNGDVWVKFKGKQAFKAKEESKIVTEAELQWEEITAEQYNNF